MFLISVGDGDGLIVAATMGEYVESLAPTKGGSVLDEGWTVGRAVGDKVKLTGIVGLVVASVGGKFGSMILIILTFVDESSSFKTNCSSPLAMACCV